MPGRPFPIISSSSSSSSSNSDSISPPNDYFPLPSSDQTINRFQPILDRFDYITKNAAEIQSNLLHSIIRENISCEYLQQFEGIEELSSWAAETESETADLTEDMARSNKIRRDANYIHEFKEMVPLITHPDIMPLIQRIAEHGNDRFPRGLLTAAPVEGLCLSSGTTDTKAKYLLYHEGLKEGTLEIGSIAAAFREGVYPVDVGSRILEFLFCGKFSVTKGGLKAGTATTHMIRSDTFRMRQQKSGLKSCSPEEVIVGAADCRQSMYCHLLCGLFHSQEVQVLSAPFAFTLVEAFRTLEMEWRQLCDDIRSGDLNPAITEPVLRDAMAQHILRKPNPELADLIAGKCRGLTSKRALKSGGAWKGVVRVLWPRCKYVLSILTGAMEVYVEKLEFYTARALPLVSADYAATEGWIGVNVGLTSRPSDVSFTILPTLAFFEFIPLNRQSTQINEICSSSGGGGGGGGAALAAYDEGAPVGLTDVKVGQEYEIVMTTAWGLYRYRLGDIVRVTGFYNSAPQVAYVCRKNVMLSLNIDKITEKDLKAVVDTAAKRLVEASGSSRELVDYTSYADRSTTPGHYVVFWEVEGESGDAAAAAAAMSSTTTDSSEVQSSAKAYKRGAHACEGHTKQTSAGERTTPPAEEEVLAECAALMDRCFVEAGYVTSRKMGSIGPLELCVVRRGTFSRLVDRFMLSGAAITQYKTPRCLVAPDALSLLRSSAVASFFSPAAIS